jgi:UDP-hydrolysing UDP-N-acetyl-D-glucosamine 2-epimerase
MYSAETWSARALSFGSLVEGLTRFMERDRPDILFITGDREEHLAAAFVGNCLRIHVAHLHGGDRCSASELDEVCRPAISKLAHFHFPATEGHRERLIRMGERPDLVWACGAPGLDRLRECPDAPMEELEKKFNLRLGDPFVLVLQHPSPTLSRGDERTEMRTLLEGVLALNIPVLCGYPNHDPGNLGIREAIDAMQQNPLLRVYHNLARQEFVTLYRNCAALVGNSSSLIIESSFLKVPAVLVGPRQDERERSTNVVRVEFDRQEIEAACRRAVFDPEYRTTMRECVSLYGDGHASPRIATILAGLSLDPKVLLKSMPY